VTSFVHRVRSSPDRWWILGTFIVALVLRVGFVLLVRRDGFILNDALIYHETAISISSGNGYGHPFFGPTAQWPPGYSYVLGALYWIVGARPLAGELLNAWLGASTVVVLFLLARRVFDRRIAIVAAAVYAMLPGPILYTDVLIAETLFTFVFAAFFLVMSYARPTVRWALLIGVVIGLGALVRGEALTWGLVPVVMWWRALPIRTLALRTATVGLAVVVVMTPWTIRNAQQMGAFVPIATNSSVTLWVGHNPDATGAQMYPPPEFYDRFGTEHPRRELESARYMRREAFRYMLTNPAHELRMIPSKLLYLNRGDSFALQWVNAQPEGTALSTSTSERIGLIADIAYYAVLTSLLLGVGVLGRELWRTPIMRGVATSLLTALFLFGFLYYGNYRYRIPYTPLMVLVASAFVMTVWRRRSELRSDMEQLQRRRLSVNGD
jgi:4-amino-4-deoxy-L-arabinose transferase-like glycosyltransferase